MIGVHGRMDHRYKIIFIQNHQIIVGGKRKNNNNLRNTTNEYTRLSPQSTKQNEQQNIKNFEVTTIFLALIGTLQPANHNFFPLSRG